MTNYWHQEVLDLSFTIQPTFLSVSNTYLLTTAANNGDTLKRTILDFEFIYQIYSDQTNPPAAGLIANSNFYYGIWFDPTGTHTAAQVPRPDLPASPWWVARGKLYPNLMVEPAQTAESQEWFFRPLAPIDSKAQRSSTPTQAGKLWFTYEFLPHTAEGGLPGTTFQYRHSGLTASLFEHH